MDSNINRRILATIRKMLSEGKYEPYLYEVEGNAINVEDTDVITCFYGTDKARLESTIQALSLFERYKAKPHSVVLVEAQFEDDLHLLEEFAGKHRFKYVYVKLTEQQCGIYVRQALLNIAVKFHSTADKLICIDSDIGFCNSYWVKNVSALLDECDVAQPFGYSYFAYGKKYEPVRAEVEKSALKTIVTNKIRGLFFNTGFAWAMTRKAFNKIGGFDVLTGPSDDVWFWYSFLGIAPSRLASLPCQTFLENNINRLLVSSNVKTNDEVCFHIEHGTLNQKRYAAYVYACNRQLPYPFCDIDYDKRHPEVLPAWKEDVWSNVRIETIRRIGGDECGNYDDSKSMKGQAKRIINAVNIDVFGKMPDRRNLTVVTCLDKRHSKEDVIVHMELFKKHLKNPFEYVCISDIPINGIRTVKPSGISEKFQALEAFRKDIRDLNGVTLYASLDTIPVDDIELCDVPDMFIGMLNPRHSKLMSDAWKIYICDVILFSGDFSFVHKNYVLSSCPFKQRKAFTQPDQCIAYNMYSQGIQIRSIAQFIDASVIPIDQARSYGEYVRAVEESAKDDKYTCTDLAIGSKRI